MLRLRVMVLLGLLSACSSPNDELVIMTYNIRHGMGFDGVLDLNRTIQVIQAAEPDIVILNEVDDSTARAFHVRQADSLGRALGMQARFGRSIDYDGGCYGNALLSRFPILSFEVIDLSTHPMLEGRSVFKAALLVRADTLLIMGTHLGLLDTEQAQQVEWILAALPHSEKVILAGDLNFTPDSPSYQRLSSRLLDGVQALVPDTEYTFPADLPRRRIDYIFVGKDIQPRGVIMKYHPQVYVASDHLPQILKFRLD